MEIRKPTWISEKFGKSPKEYQRMSLILDSSSRRRLVFLKWETNSHRDAPYISLRFDEQVQSVVQHSIGVKERDDSELRKKSSLKDVLNRLIPHGILLHEAEELHFDGIKEHISLEQIISQLRSEQTLPEARIAHMEFSGSVADFDDLEHWILSCCRFHDLYLTRLLKNAHSSECVILPMKSIRTVQELKLSLKKYVYPWTEITFKVSRTQDSQFPPRPSYFVEGLDISELPWAIEYETSVPTKFDQNLIQTEMKSMFSKWGQVIVDARVGYAQKDDRNKNVFYPLDGEAKCQMGILLTPTKEAFGEFQETGSIRGIPRRLVLTTTLGAVPITIQNPAHHSFFFNLGGRPNEQQKQTFQNRKMECIKENPFLSVSDETASSAHEDA